MPGKSKSLVPIEQIDEMIRTIRGVRVMLDRDLAKIYGVPTFRFNEAIKRNRHRFPPDFMFQLTGEEFNSLRSQIAMSKRKNSSQIAMSSGKHRGAAYDHFRQVFRIKQPGRWERPQWDRTMTAMMIEDGKRVATGGARFQWHMRPFADIDLIARNTGGKWGRV
jgi:hypothetical protein